MDDVHESWDMSQSGNGETAADDSETGQVFSTLPVPLRVGAVRLGWYRRQSKIEA